MKHLFGLFAGLLAAVATTFAVPPNDDFADAIDLGGSASVRAIGDNFEATLEQGEVDAPFGERTGSIWYCWEAPSSGWFRVDTMGSDLDSIVAVGTGTTLANYMEIVFNDQAAGGFNNPGFRGESALLFEAVAGTVYKVSVGGWLGAEGNVALNINPSAGPTGRIVSTTVAPGSADVSAGPADLTVTVSARADMEIGQVQLQLLSDSGTLAFASVPGSNPVSGTPMDGVWEVMLSVPMYLAPGNLELGYILTGSSGEAVAGYGNDYDGFLPVPAGLVTSVPVINHGMVDSAGPVVESLSLDPTSVDVTSGAATVSCEIRCTDDLSGTSFVDLEIVDSMDDGIAFSVATPFDLTSGDANDGIYSVGFNLRQGLAPGSYYISIFTNDGLGNGRSFSSLPGTGQEELLPGGPVLTIVNTGFVGTPFDRWTSEAGLADPNDAHGAIPFNDGVSNLLKYAFNMNGAGRDHQTLAAGTGTSGLPTVYPSPEGFTVEFVERRGDELLFYEVETNTNGNGFVRYTGLRTGSPIDDAWSRVRVPISAGPGDNVISRIRVDYRE